MDFIIKTFNNLSLNELYEILQARSAVFVVEQNCVYQDIDGIDLSAYHLMLRDETGIKAYIRIYKLENGYVKIGRVLTTERGKGYGGVLLSKAVEQAKEIFAPQTIYIEAQAYAIGFYEKAGFKVVSEPFMEDGIPHVKMTLDF